MDKIIENMLHRLKNGWEWVYASQEMLGTDPELPGL